MKILRYLLLPFAFAYSLTVRFRNWLYDKKIIKSYSFSKPYIIVVGNLAVGGSGKTPFTEYLVNLLKDEFKIAVLSRGYKRKTKGFLIAKPDSTPAEIGDEPAQIKQKFPDITVAVSEDRVKGIKKLSAHNFDIIILDDAFQHRRLTGNLNILLTDCNSPFYNDFFLPAGNLRDNKKQYKRADIIVFTKCPENLQPACAKKMQERLKPFEYQKVFFTTLEYKKPVNPYNRKELEINTLKEFDTLVFCGLAKSKYLTSFLAKYAKSLTTVCFPDHYNYSEKDAEKIFLRFKKSKAKKKIIITTEKDFVKIKNLKNYEKFKENLFVIPIEIKFLFNLQEIFNHQIKSYVGKNSSNR